MSKTYSTLNLNHIIDLLYDVNIAECPDLLKGLHFIGYILYWLQLESGKQSSNNRTFAHYKKKLSHLYGSHFAIELT